jgi:hypothetical protein
LKNFIKKYEVYIRVDDKVETKSVIGNFGGTKSQGKILGGLKTKL